MLPLSVVDPASVVVISVAGSVTAAPAVVSVLVDSTAVESEELMSALVFAPALESLAAVLEIESSAVCVQPAEDDDRSPATGAGAAVWEESSATVGAE